MVFLGLSCYIQSSNIKYFIYVKVTVYDVFLLSVDDSYYTVTDESLCRNGQLCYPVLVWYSVIWFSKEYKGKPGKRELYALFPPK